MAIFRELGIGTLAKRKSDLTSCAAQDKQTLKEQKFGTFARFLRVRQSGFNPAEHMVPNEVLGFFEFQGERERGKLSVFKGLQKPLSAQIQRKLKMCRLPPATEPLDNR